jgi:hypothetical protein
VHPAIPEAYREGKLNPIFEQIRSSGDSPHALSRDEEAVVAILKQFQ